MPRRPTNYWKYDTHAKASENQVRYALIYLKIKGLPTDVVTAELKELGATEEQYGGRIADWLRAKNTSELSTLIEHLKSLPTPPRPPTAVDEEAQRMDEHSERLREAELAKIVPLYLSGLSISAIADRTHFGYETVKDTLIASGVALRTKAQQRFAKMIAEERPDCERERAELLAAITKVRSL